MDIKNYLPYLYKLLTQRQYDPSLQNGMDIRNNTVPDAKLIDNLIGEVSEEGPTPAPFPSEIGQGGVPLNGRENSPEALRQVFNNMAKEAADTGNAPFSDGKDFIYDDVMSNTPATASAAAMVDNNPNIGLEGLANNILGGVTGRVGNGEYSIDDIAGMADEDLDLDTLDMLKKLGQR